MIEQVFYRDTRPGKDWFATENFRILRHHAAHDRNYALETQSIQANITDHLFPFQRFNDSTNYVATARLISLYGKCRPPAPAARHRSPLPRSSCQAPAVPAPTRPAVSGCSAPPPRFRPDNALPPSAQTPARHGSAPDFAQSGCRGNVFPPPRTHKATPAGRASSDREGLRFHG